MRYHRDILIYFVKSLTPMLSGELSFGIASNNYDCIYPEPETLSLMPLEKKILLKTIKIKQFENNKFLSAIQLEFTNGMSTPLFQSGIEEELGRQPKSLNIDPTRRIAQVSMNVHVSSIHGLRLLDDNGDYIIDIVWHCKGALGEWVT